MKLTVATIVAAAALAQGANGLSSMPEWNEWKNTHSREYPSMAEEAKRMEIFLENKRIVAEHNLMYEAGNVTHYLELNKFADISREEFAERM